MTSPAPARSAKPKKAWPLRAGGDAGGCAGDMPIAGSACIAWLPGFEDRALVPFGSDHGEFSQPLAQLFELAFIDYQNHRPWQVPQPQSVVFRAEEIAAAVGRVLLAEGEFRRCSDHDHPPARIEGQRLDIARIADERGVRRSR